MPATQPTPVGPDFGLTKTELISLRLCRRVQEEYEQIGAERFLAQSPGKPQQGRDSVLGGKLGGRVVETLRSFQERSDGGVSMPAAVHGAPHTVEVALCSCRDARI